MSKLKFLYFKLFNRLLIWCNQKSHKRIFGCLFFVQTNLIHFNFFELSVAKLILILRINYFLNKLSSPIPYLAKIVQISSIEDLAKIISAQIIFRKKDHVSY